LPGEDQGTHYHVSRLEFTPSEPNIEKVTIEGPNGEDIRATVHIASVASADDGMKLAEKVFLAAVDWIVFRYDVAIENIQLSRPQFYPLNPPEGFGAQVRSSASIDSSLTVNLALTPTEIKSELEQPPLPGEHYYGLFRAARQSQSHVEEFMLHYHIMLMLCNRKYPKGEQRRVDNFIKTKEPLVPQTPDPRDPKKKETIYTWLRNELAHARKNVDLNRTKSEMKDRLHRLMDLTKQAIKQYP
jgi:hypothetical protein